MTKPICRTQCHLRGKRITHSLSLTPQIMTWKIRFKTTMTGFWIAVYFVFANCLTLSSQPSTSNPAYNTVVAALANVYAYTFKDSLTAQGTGIILNDSGFIVTNYSAIAGGQKIVVKLQGKVVKHSGLIGVDVEKDLAILKLAKQGFPAVE